MSVLIVFPILDLVTFRENSDSFPLKRSLLFPGVLHRINYLQFHERDFFLIRGIISESLVSALTND